MSTRSLEPTHRPPEGRTDDASSDRYVVAGQALGPCTRAAKHGRAVTGQASSRRSPFVADVESIYLTGDIHLQVVDDDTEVIHNHWVWGQPPLGTTVPRRCGQRPHLQIVEAEQAQVNQGVVVTAEETEVVDDSLSTISPRNEVVYVAPLGRPATPGSDAMTVSGNDSPTEAGRYHSGLASHIEDL